MQLSDILQGMRVPGASIAFITISAAVAVFLPFILFIWYKSKHNIKLLPSLLGVGVFVLFALILRPLLLSVLQLDLLIGVFPTPPLNAALYIVIICLTSGLFEETGRFIAFKWILKKDGGKIRTPLSYGVGHGGGEAIILVGFSMINLLITSALINNGQILRSGLSDTETAELISFIQTDSVVFLASGVERVLAIALHIALSVMVWLAVSRRQYWMYPAAVLLHALTNVSAVLYQLDIIENLWLVEGLVLVCVLITAALTRLAYVKLPNRAPDLPEPGSEPPIISEE